MFDLTWQIFDKFFKTTDQGTFKKEKIKDENFMWLGQDSV